MAARQGREKVDRTTGGRAFLSKEARQVLDSKPVIMNKLAGIGRSSATSAGIRNTGRWPAPIGGADLLVKKVPEDTLLDRERDTPEVRDQGQTWLSPVILL